ncbi:MAG: Rieske 2Fe-2S domain-containing protein [Acidobacteriota bacterium]
MSVSYQAVGWNRQKRVYDLVLWGGILLYLATFIGVGSTVHPQATAETLLLRALGTGAFLLLHVILAIGPLCRLDPRFLPLLYNRRHLGVSMFVLALAHGAFATLQFHAFGDLNPLVSVLSSDGSFASLATFPFQPFGAAALVILFGMAATSHDFWLANLSAPVWKALHMLVYLAYGLLVLHVAFGALRSEPHPVYIALLAAGALILAVLHALAARREAAIDGERLAANREGYVEVCAVDEIRENRARIAPIGGERVAIFRYEGQVSAMSNVCQHQNGPLGEGKIVDGCVVCPWHGYQYRPQDGTSPPPFTERIPTFRTRIVDGRVWVHPTPLPAGTAVEPSRIPGAAARPQESA